MARRYEFYFRVAKYCFCHEKIEFISSSRRVMFFLDIDKKTSMKYRYSCQRTRGMKSYRRSTQATRANPSAFSWLGSMYILARYLQWYQTNGERLSLMLSLTYVVFKNFTSGIFSSNIIKHNKQYNRSMVMLRNFIGMVTF